ncbi:MAG: sugar phosphate nucleotidyltransferase [Bacteroidota bacterium]
MREPKPTLVILAAGMGSRYGGLKQMDTFTPEGDTIIDFSLYDAIRAGFGKIVFIIRKSFEKEFKEIFDSKLKDKIEVRYVFQDTENVPAKYFNPEREKPWGTGHALLMAKEEVNENFAIINADDFYGREAFEVMVNQLQETDEKSLNFSMVAYLLKNTVTDHGYVSRGVCEVNSEDQLLDVIERTHIESINNQLIYKTSDSISKSIEPNTVVSMNFWGFTPKVFDLSEKFFLEFLDKSGKELKTEFFIPIIISQSIKRLGAVVHVLTSDSKWFGVTYKEDKINVQKEIENLKKTKVYPESLW